MDEACNLRLQALTMKQETLETTIGHHEVKLEMVSVSVQNIDNTLSKIKYTLFGAVGLYVFQTMGFSDFIKWVI